MMKNLVDYLNKTQELFPDKTAFTDGTEELSFRELFCAVNFAAAEILERKIHKAPIVIFMKKSPFEVAAFLAVLKSGNHYVPIDSEMPERRISLILENVKTSLMITDEECFDDARKVSGETEVVTWQNLLEEGKKLTADKRESLLETAKEAFSSNDPAYVLFTSGSTGVPKGVCVNHKSAVNYIERLTETLNIDESNVFGEQAPLYFDASLKEIYMTIKTGATTILIPKELFRIPVRLVEFINEHQINTLCWVVSALTFVSGFGTLSEVRPDKVKLITFVGEVFPVIQLKKWREALPETKFVNLYGPTECTGVSTFFEINPGEDTPETVPCGKPFPGTDIYILRENGTIADASEIGEICIGGAGVSMGYYNDPERTAEAFIKNPFSNTNETIYKTGDLGKIDSEGNLIFISRKDFQIKHMGHRIELGEIESDVSLIPGVSMNACVYDQKRSKIVLFYTGTVDKKELTEELKRLLQRYMLPNRIEKLENMPFTATGKIDRKSLSEMV